MKNPVLATRAKPGGVQSKAILAEWQLTFANCFTKGEAQTTYKRLHQMIMDAQDSDSGELLSALTKDFRAAIAALPWQAMESAEFGLYQEHVAAYNDAVRYQPYKQSIKTVTGAQLKAASGLALGERLMARQLAKVILNFEGVWISDPYEFYKEWSAENNRRQSQWIRSVQNCAVSD